MSGYYVPGSNGNDNLSSNALVQILAGLAGNDVLTTNLPASGVPMVNMAGGSGDDTYVLNNTYGSVLIADLSGNDVLQLPFTKGQIRGTINSSSIDTGHATVDGSHYVMMFSETFGILFLNYSGRGRIETVRYSDGETESMSSLSSLFGSRGSFNSKDLGIADEMATMIQIDNACAHAEEANANIAVPSYFNAEAYLERHRVKTSGNMAEEQHTDGFLMAGFIGQEGAYRHFLGYGQWEDVSPSSLFDADYYYKSKAADFNNISVSRVTSAQVAEIQGAIHGAGMNAWSHYNLCGTREGIDASAAFDTSAYMEAKARTVNMSVDELADVFESFGFSALTHYELFGKAEGIPLVGVGASADAMFAMEESA